MASLKVSGIGAVAKNLLSLQGEMRDQAQAALRTESELIMTEAKERTPVDTGALRGSGRVDDRTTAAAVRMALSFGGPSQQYAIHVHENLEARHPTGRAKFLESAVLEAVGNLPQKIAARMKL